MCANCFSTKIDKNLADRVYSELKTDCVEFVDAPNALWRANLDGVCVILYKSMKILVQGKKTDEFVSKYLNAENVSQKTLSLPECSIEHEFSSWIGTDESGKGDFFGPLVVASVMVDENSRGKLETLGIKDSKKLSDKFILEIAPKIKVATVNSVVVIPPVTYNKLYADFKNLNKLLAWGHARAIENVLEKKECENAISDKFGDESLIKNALMKNGRKINLIQRTKAESDLAVAAASVIARAEFVMRIKRMENEFGLSFSKGASDKVNNEAKLFVQKYGNSELNKVCKLHFKNAKLV